ncbi:hypothetical protein BU17DRAFT_82176 [Hysterangium stoloniferum]|nr:hypothetical protein BU17DRAFT_82176 [Hysterangium stoloniferum]
MPPKPVSGASGLTPALGTSQLTTAQIKEKMEAAKQKCEEDKSQERLLAENSPYSLSNTLEGDISKLQLFPHNS